MRSWAPSTLAAYESDWFDFSAWSLGLGAGDPLEATDTTVAAYITSLVRDRLAVATIRRRVASIA